MSEHRPPGGEGPGVPGIGAKQFKEAGRGWMISRTVNNDSWLTIGKAAKSSMIVTATAGMDPVGIIAL